MTDPDKVPGLHHRVEMGTYNTNKDPNEATNAELAKMHSDYANAVALILRVAADLGSQQQALVAVVAASCILQDSMVHNAGATLPTPQIVGIMQGAGALATLMRNRGDIEIVVVDRALS
jgi:hypothetical protein